MRDSSDLVVSVPPRELEAIRPPGSVFPSQALESAALSPELRLALSLFADRDGENLRFVARPEIFTHGESLAWLRAQIGPARRHLAFSDGTAIPLIPGLANHVFFHGASRRADNAALASLETRVPELFQQLQGQVNTAFRFGPQRFAPDSFVWPGRSDSRRAAAGLLRFYSHPHSVEQSSAAIRHWGEVRPAARFASLLHIALTEASLDDAAFLSAVAARVARAFFRPADAVLLRLPATADALEATLRALRGVGAPIPGAPSANVFMAANDPTHTQLAAMADRLQMFTHDSFDFWRHDANFYCGFASLEVAARRRRHAPEAAPVLVAELTGRGAEIVWPPARTVDRGPP